MKELKDKGAVVTGAASGMGKAVAMTRHVADFGAKSTSIHAAIVGRQPVITSVLLLAFLFFVTAACGQEPPVQTGGSAASRDGDVSETGKKLSNPLSNVWAMFTEFDVNFSGGKVNSGHKKAGSRMIFQPIMPIPLYGRGEKEWRLITRPTIPVLFSEPIPVGQDKFEHKASLGDIQVPMLISPPVKNWILGAGPTWLFPTATKKEFGRQQWGAGPAVVVGHYNEKVTMGVFPQYFFGIGSRGRSNGVADASYLNLLYFTFYNLPKAWQVGFSPTITYDRRASTGNKWNVPVGATVWKTAKVGNTITKFELGIEYSVVKQRDFGQRVAVKFSVIPVIPSLIRKPLFGGE
jgi:hypothetical protein